MSPLPCSSKQVLVILVVAAIVVAVVKFRLVFNPLLIYMHLILPAALGPGVYSASNRNEYKNQKNNVFGE
jgi:hypothetical protein